jgi:Fe-S cluster assembly protein SufD
MSVSLVVEKEKAPRPMTVHVTKTKAETALSEGFAAVEAKLPGGDHVQTLRREAIGVFASLGLPHRRIEDWKYTDLRALQTEAYPRGHGGIAGTQVIAEALDGTIAGLLPGLDAHTIVFMDGAFVTSTLPQDQGGVDFHPLDKALESGAAWVDQALEATTMQADGIVALNTAYMSGGLALRVNDGVTLDKPIHAVFLSSGGEPKAITTRLIVSVGSGVTMTLIESHLCSARQDNTLTQITAGDHARVTHVKNLHTSGRSIHLANWLVQLGANVTYRPFQLTTGDGLVRNSMQVTFAGQHSSFDLGAATLGTSTAHADLTLVVDHAVPHCISRELFKCVLDDKSRAIFQGKVIVRPDAQKTDGKQMAQALLLSPDAEFDSKPELEIYADDVVCGHGSTSAELDEDLLFYCRSRGIPLETARAMLVESFIGEAIDKVENETLRDALMVRARAALTR